MTDYLVIGFPHQSGSWAAVFPDFVGVTGRGRDLTQAIDQAIDGAIAVIEILTKIGTPLPLPKDLRRIQQDHAWANEYGINWSCDVVSTVALHAQPIREPAPANPKEHRQRQPVAAGAVDSDVRMPAPAQQASVAVGLVPNQEIRRAESHV